MTRPDLNLLIALEALLVEGSVVRAAARLGLSASATSRALERLRQTTGDPLLVRAGRGLVPTPRAMELRNEIGNVVRHAESFLLPNDALDLAKLDRTFTIRTGEGFLENFGARLVDMISRQAPGASIAFVPKLNKDNDPIRGGKIDLDVGVIGQSTGPELRAQTLFRDRYVGVVRRDHSLCHGTITPQRYADGKHVEILRRGNEIDQVAAALQSLDLKRHVVAAVTGFSGALVLAAGSDLIATVPERNAWHLRDNLWTFPLPFDVADVTVSLLWHPQYEADPAHRWLRQCVRDICCATRSA